MLCHKTNHYEKQLVTCLKNYTHRNKKDQFIKSSHLFLRWTDIQINFNLDFKSCPWSLFFFVYSFGENDQRGEIEIAFVFPLWHNLVLTDEYFDLNHLKNGPQYQSCCISLNHIPSYFSSIAKTHPPSVIYCFRKLHFKRKKDYLKPITLCEKCIVCILHYIHSLYSALLGQLVHSIWTGKLEFPIGNLNWNTTSS